MNQVAFWDFCQFLYFVIFNLSITLLSKYDFAKLDWTLGYLNTFLCIFGNAAIIKSNCKNMNQVTFWDLCQFLFFVVFNLSNIVVKICLAHLVTMIGLGHRIGINIHACQPNLEIKCHLYTKISSKTIANVSFCTIKPQKECLLNGNVLTRVQRVNEPVDLWDITFCTHWFWGLELSFIEQTALADPNF